MGSLLSKYKWRTVTAVSLFVAAALAVPVSFVSFVGIVGLASGWWLAWGRRQSITRPAVRQDPTLAEEHHRKSMRSVRWFIAWYIAVSLPRYLGEELFAERPWLRLIFGIYVALATALCLARTWDDMQPPLVLPEPAETPREHPLLAEPTALAIVQTLADANAYRLREMRTKVLARLTRIEAATLRPAIEELEDADLIETFRERGRSPERDVFWHQLTERGARALSNHLAAREG